MDEKIEYMELCADLSLCERCGECERKLPRFIKEYHGKLVFPKKAYEREDVRAGILSMVDTCKCQAITIKDTLMH